MKSRVMDNTEPITRRRRDRPECLKARLLRRVGGALWARVCPRVCVDTRVCPRVCSARALSLNINMPGVYLSYPFCAQKCTYCNFASGVFPRQLESRYFETLRAELRERNWPWTPETIYLGGGTPSQMDRDALTKLLAEIPGRDWPEATMEAAPGSLKPEKVDAWRRAGISRVSLGVQSFVTKELSRTGRKHTAATVVDDVAMLRAAGIANINLDLIAGLPFQTRESWHESLSWIERIGAPHASVYMLEVDDDSNLGRELLWLGSRYGAGAVPCEDDIADSYEIAVERLNKIGIERYEISN